MGVRGGCLWNGTRAEPMPAAVATIPAPPPPPPPNLQLFGSAWDPSDPEQPTAPRMNYNSFGWALLSVLELLTGGWVGAGAGAPRRRWCCNVAA